MKFTGCVLNTRVDRNGEVFSSECLGKVARDVGAVPFSIFFNYRIGEAFNFRYNENAEQLLCDMEAPHADLDISKLFPVISFLRGDDGTIEICEVSLVSTPASIGMWIRKIENE